MKLPSKAFVPEYLSHISNWHGHIAFAMDLMYCLKPKLFVELGVHYGDSYFTFCQAVQQFNLNCICFGIDNWLGDEHSGYYGEDVYNDVLLYNGNYSGFSNLMKLSFDNALSEFDDNSIDILHLDGCHTYDSVKHDFYSWIPKLSQNCFVLLHDVCIQRENFGVFQFWNEISSHYPSFTFTHSCGLGIIQKSCDAIDFSVDGLDFTNSDSLNKYYELCSERAQLTFRLNLAKKKFSELYKYYE